MALAFWQEQYHLSPGFLGLLGAFSPNAIGAGGGAHLPAFAHGGIGAVAGSSAFERAAAADFLAVQGQASRFDPWPCRHVWLLELVGEDQRVLLRTVGAATQVQAVGIEALSLAIGMASIALVCLGVFSVFVPLLTATGFTTLAVILTGFLVVSGVIGFAWAPRNEGKRLEQLEAERHDGF